MNEVSMNENLFNPEAEEAVLSIVLNHADKIYELAGLKHYMFSSKPAQEIYKQLESMVANNVPLNIPLLENYLATFGSLEAIGGVEHLKYLQSREYDPETMKHYSAIVIGNYKARGLISITAGVSPDSITNAENVDSAIFQIRDKLDGLLQVTGGESTQRIGNIVSDVWKELKRRMEHKGIHGVSTGYNNLDKVTSGFGKGELWYIAGRPGQGKTAFLCNLILNGALAEVPTKSVMFSLEMDRQSLIERLIAAYTDLELSTTLRMGYMTVEDANRVTETLNLFKSLPIYIDTNFSSNVDYIKTSIRKLARTDGLDIAYIDYIQLLAERDTDATQALGKISRDLKLLAGELGIPIVVASQLNRQVEMRPDKRPILSDLRQSGNLEEDADGVIGLYRESYYKETKDTLVELETILLKQRNGPTGSLMLDFDLRSNSIKEKHKNDGKQTKKEGPRVGEGTRSVVEQIFGQG